MSRPKKYPEFELAPKLTAAVAEAIGVTRMNKTSSETRNKIADLVQHAAARIAAVLDAEDSGSAGARKADDA